jgi:hypothetical protein
MSTVPDLGPYRDDAADQKPAVAAAPFEMEETVWGYIIHNKEPAPFWLYVSQLTSWVVGVLFATVAIGMWTLPGVGGAQDMLTLKIGATIPMSGVAILLFWYASRGTQTEVQIDTTRGEVREMLRNRAGRTTLLGLYGFDAIGGVFMERSETRRSGHVQLVLRYRNTAQVLRVARGPETLLEGLRDRLGGDLMVRRRSTASQDERRYRPVPVAT